ncbi:MAG: hypothetical protein RLZZ292_139 [Bacteroidota bacterium]|jgi:hypothetical protein
MKSIYQQVKQDTLSKSVCSCDDPIECLRHMFCDLVQKARVEKGQCPVRRPVFLRTHGSIKGTLQILPDIPANLQHGMFAPPFTSHSVYVRYSSDLSDGRPDWKSTIGLGIKIFDVAGEKVVSDDGANTADLLFQNVPFFFVDTARDMCGFTKASFEGNGDAWVEANAPNTNNLLDAMAKSVFSVLETTVWSVVPFKLGDGNYCKYLARPGISTFVGEFDTVDPDFLAKDLSARMLAGMATLDIFIQPRPDAAIYDETYLDEHFPLDRATVVWDETIAIPIKVATITLPQQDITVAEQATYGDWLSFNIGRVPLANAPVGTIADARMSVYQTSADYRREKNSQPVTEPTAPSEPIITNPTCPFPHQTTNMEEQPKPLTLKQIASISSVRIHPGIGVARVGNSASYYIGPEVIEPTRTQFGETRDASGAIKRQAARFRVYGYDVAGNVVAEIQQSTNTSVKWSVHLANKKAAWYQFHAAMDIPATADMTVPLRNPTVLGDYRDALVIDAGEKSIMGIKSADSSYIMSGAFQGTPVTLGELRTDSVGRLLVLPAQGVSASPEGTPIIIVEKLDSSFNNADGWYDDMADGSVKAKVTIGGKDFDADSAWVTVGPPNFAPDIVGWRTMDDLLRDLYIKAKLLPMPKPISFNQHVRPVLERLSGLQWVNKGFSAMFGADSPMNFQDPTLMQKLTIAPPQNATKLPDAYGELRRTIYNSFRTIDNTAIEPRTWPWIYGDAFGYSDDYPSQYLALPTLFDSILKSWVEGSFINDYDPKATAPQTLPEVPLQEQPEMLDRAAMHFCLADAFHPGAELTWPMRNASMYRAPYRLKVRPAGEKDPTYGATLDQATVLSLDGPLHAQSPGDLTRWMALPWQGDTAYCRSGYMLDYDPYLPTFWPARVPNHVLSEVDYETLCDTTAPMEARIVAFQNRSLWMRTVPQTYGIVDQMNYMVANFGEMGVVESRPKPADIDWLPDWVFVENLSEKQKAVLDNARPLLKAAHEKLSEEDRNLAAAGWTSQEQLDTFLRIKRRGK